jgi:ADP-heptose:LPS heptosyltransferase
MQKNKVLIIRFSSFGDIVQCSSVVESIRQRFNRQAELHWVTRKDFENLVTLNSGVNKVWALDKKNGFGGLIRLAISLRKENFTHIYDAHNNLRSRILKILLLSKFSRPSLVTRSKDRWKRILLFNFRINKFPKPFIGIDSYLSPLIKWDIKKSHSPKLVEWNFSKNAVEKIDFIINETTGAHKIIALVPSAAWEMKRWPLEHWKKLITILPEARFVVLGGKEDLFCQDLADVAPERVFNLAGKLSLIESCRLVQKSELVISADTGLLHVADVLGVKALSLMGPTAFGFTISSLIKTMQVDLPCRPCTKDGRGKCSQNIYQLCMVDITPVSVAEAAQDIIRE